MSSRFNSSSETRIPSDVYNRLVMELEEKNRIIQQLNEDCIKLKSETNHVQAELELELIKNSSLFKASAVDRIDEGFGTAITSSLRKLAKKLGVELTELEILKDKSNVEVVAQCFLALENGVVQFLKERSKMLSTLKEKEDRLMRQDNLLQNKEAELRLLRGRNSELKQERTKILTEKEEGLLKQEKLLQKKESELRQLSEQNRELKQKIKEMSDNMFVVQSPVEKSRAWLHLQPQTELPLVDAGVVTNKQLVRGLQIAIDDDPSNANIRDSKQILAAITQVLGSAKVPVEQPNKAPPDGRYDSSIMASKTCGILDDVFMDFPVRVLNDPKQGSSSRPDDIRDVVESPVKKLRANANVPLQTASTWNLPSKDNWLALVTSEDFSKEPCSALKLLNDSRLFDEFFFAYELRRISPKAVHCQLTVKLWKGQTAMRFASEGPTEASAKNIVAKSALKTIVSTINERFCIAVIGSLNTDSQLQTKRIWNKLFKTKTPATVLNEEFQKRGLLPPQPTIITVTQTSFFGIYSWDGKEYISGPCTQKKIAKQEAALLVLDNCFNSS